MQRKFTNVNTRSGRQGESLAAGCGCCAASRLHAASCCEAANEVIKLAACRRLAAVPPLPAARLSPCLPLRSASYGTLTHPVGSSLQSTKPNGRSMLLISFTLTSKPLSNFVMNIIKSIITSGFFMSSRIFAVSTDNSP